jgi:hypothetical protein
MEVHKFDKKIEIVGREGFIPATCTAMILRFDFGTYLGHFVPYIKIGDSWYMADNEKGGLVRRAHGMPDGRTSYFGPDRSVSGILRAAHLFYCPDLLVDAETRPKKNYTGLPVFGQTGDTCGPDALQSILMFADGFHAYFDKLYRGLVPRFNIKFFGGVHEEVSAGEVTAELTKLKRELHTLMGGSACQESATLDFLLSMFLRLYRIENTPEEELAGIEWGENITIGDTIPVPEEKMAAHRRQQEEAEAARELGLMDAALYRVLRDILPPRAAENTRTNVERVRAYREGRL